MDEELPEDEMGINMTERLSIGCMKADEGVRESRADLKARGTSVVPYVHWSEDVVRTDKGQLEEKRTRANGRSRRKTCGSEPTILRPRGSEGYDA